MIAFSDAYQVGNFIDTFALGHYARVLDAQRPGVSESVALKIMRSEHLPNGGDTPWEYHAFISEARLLLKLADDPHVVDLLDCGFVESQSEVPASGSIVSFGTDAASFSQAMTEYAEKNWRPYLTLPNLPRTRNLFYLMKPASSSVRWRLPTEEGLALALQFGHLLQIAHRQGIVYLDHKLEHVYWDGTRLEVIDLNSSRLVDDHDASREHYFRMDIHNLCVGILYPIFTGLSPQKTTLRPQPSNRSEVEARYQDITELDFGVEPTLSMALKALLQRGAAQEIPSAERFLQQLEEVAAIYGWDFPENYTSPASRDARDHIRSGLRKLRDGQTAMREARDLFRDAAILDGITDDLESELRRLVKAANDMLNHRVIP